MVFCKWLCAGFALLFLTMLSGASAQPALTLRIGLAEDPDLLDPTLARTYVGRIVFASMCDKLVDISPELDIVPQLASESIWDNSTKLARRLPGLGAITSLVVVGDLPFRRPEDRELLLSGLRLTNGAAS